MHSPKLRCNRQWMNPRYSDILFGNHHFHVPCLYFWTKGERDRKKERKKERRKEGRKERRKEGKKEGKREKERKKERKKESHRSLPSLSRIYMSRGLARFAIVSIGPDTLWEWNTAMKHRIGMEHQSVQFDWRMFFLPGSFNHQQTHPKQAFFK